MLPTDAFFTDLEQVIAQAGPADRPRLRRLAEELDHMAARVPRVADRCYAYQARVYARVDEYEQARQAVDRALELSPLDDNLLILRGDINRAAEAYTLALQDYTRVLEERPEAVTARIHRAEILHATGELPQALDDIQEALRHEPRPLRLLYRRGLILADLRRPQAAAADFRAVAQMSPDPELRRKAEQRLRELGER